MHASCGTSSRVFDYSTACLWCVSRSRHVLCRVLCSPVVVAVLQVECPEYAYRSKLHLLYHLPFDIMRLGSPHNFSTEVSV